MEVRSANWRGEPTRRLIREIVILETGTRIRDPGNGAGPQGRDISGLIASGMPIPNRRSIWVQDHRVGSSFWSWKNVARQVPSGRRGAGPGHTELRKVVWKAPDPVLD